MSSPFPEILVLIGLTLLEAFFVASEIALVSIRRSRVDQLVDEGSRGARRVRRLLDDPGRFLAVSQLGLTFIGFFASAYAALSLVDGLKRVLQQASVPEDTAAIVALIAVTVILALFTIVFAELVPKTLALANPERYALALSRPIDFLARLLGPVVVLLTWLTRTITRVLGSEVSSDAAITAEELRLIVERGGEQGILEAEEEQMINAVIELGGRRVHEVMVPRVSIVGLRADASFEEAIDVVIAEGHSRIPAYENSLDEVVGILYAKDLLPYLKSDAEPRPALRKLLRPPVLVPESMTIDDLLHELQRRKVHIAIVLDEYGGTAGIVTIEDLLEEIVGEIADEFDVEEPPIEHLPGGALRVTGSLPIGDLSEELGVELPDEEWDTVGGLVLNLLGHVPEPRETVLFQGYEFRADRVQGRRIISVRIRPVERQSEKKKGTARSRVTESAPPQ